MNKKQIVCWLLCVHNGCTGGQTHTFPTRHGNTEWLSLLFPKHLSQSDRELLLSSIFATRFYEAALFRVNSKRFQRNSNFIVILSSGCIFILFLCLCAHLPLRYPHLKLEWTASIRFFFRFRSNVRPSLKRSWQLPMCVHRCCVVFSTLGSLRSNRRIRTCINFISQSIQLNGSWKRYTYVSLLFCSFLYSCA